jgi:hypothetical protein
MEARERIDKGSELCMKTEAFVSADFAAKIYFGMSKGGRLVRLHSGSREKFPVRTKQN